MKSKSGTTLLITIFVMALIYLVYFFWVRTPNYFLISNGSEQSISFKLDGNPYQLAKGQFMTYEPKDSFHIVYESLDTAFAVYDKSYLVNPTASEHLLYKRPYGVVKNKDSIFTSQKTEWNDKLYYGKLKVKTDPVISDFDLNLNQDFPSWNLKKSKETTFFTKIFTPEDFREFYFENYE